MLAVIGASSVHAAPPRTAVPQAGKVAPNPIAWRDWSDQVFADARAQKKYVLLANTGHDPNPAMIEAQYDILKTRIVPLVK